MRSVDCTNTISEKRPEVQGVPDLIWDREAMRWKLDIGAVDVLRGKRIQDPMNTPCSKAQSLW